MMRRSLLICGVLAPLIYVGADVLAAIRHPDYHSFTSQTVSELMARGAPTERLVDPLFLLTGPLMMAFGVGVWMSEYRRRVHVLGALLFLYAAIGLLGPLRFEMNVRGTAAFAQDVPHIVLTAVLVVVVIASVGFGASIRGRSFRLYSFATLLIGVVFGAFASVQFRGLATGQPTPWLGLTERISIGTFLLWVVVLAVSLLRGAPARRAVVDETRDAHQAVIGPRS
jgi:hypothetical protein